MKFYIKAFITAVCMALSICNVQAKSKDDKAVYAFIYGTCFNDSIVYISSIERLSNTAIDKKTNFLNDRSNYTNAFKNYLDNKYQEPHTCLFSLRMMFSGYCSKRNIAPIGSCRLR